MKPETAQEILELTIQSELVGDPDKSAKTGNKCTTFKRPLSCCQCGKAFATKSKLDCHERIHNDEKPFSCSNCDMKFSQLAHLKTHERIHTGEKPFSCFKCEKKFSQAANFKRHEKTHTN